MSPKINFDFETTHLIIQKISVIDSFKGEWNVIIDSNTPKLDRLKQKSVFEGVGASTRFEVDTLPDSEIELFLAKSAKGPPLGKQEEVILGCYEAQLHVFENHQSMTLSEKSLVDLHKMLLKYSDKQGEFAGKYKVTSNKNVSDQPKYEHQVFFNTTVPYIAKKEVRELLAWMNQEISSKKIHPLILIGTFVYEFMAIAPFQYANGRIARLLISMFMLDERYNFIRHMSFDKVLEERKAAYFNVLMAGQRHRYRYTEREKISAWIIFFLNSLELVIRKLEANYGSRQRKAKQEILANKQQVMLAENNESVYLNNRQKNIIEYISRKGPVKIGDIKDQFPKISRNTIKKDLLHFQTSELTNQIGRGRGTYYTSKV